MNNGMFLFHGLHKVNWARCSVPGNATILDVGCGDGAVWIDRSDVTSLANEWCDKEGEICHPDILGDAHDIPCSDNSFDVVACMELLEHVRDPHKVLMECLRVSRFKVLVTVPCEGMWPVELKPFTNKYHIRYYDLLSFGQELDKTHHCFELYGLMEGMVWLAGVIYKGLCYEEKVR